MPGSRHVLFRGAAQPIKQYSVRNIRTRREEPLTQGTGPRCLLPSRSARRSCTASLSGCSVAPPPDRSPEVVPANRTLEARPDRRVAVVLAQLDSLVHGAVAVTEVRSLRGTEMDAEALR